MYKTIFHPSHRTASSQRTRCQPIYGADENGKIIWRGESQKSASYWNVPLELKIFVHFYTANSGKRYIIVYDAVDDLPSLFSACAATTNPQRLCQLFEGINIPADSEIVKKTLSWLFHLED